MNESCEEKGVSLLSYAMLGAAVLYVFSPINIPSDIPIVGWLDDIFVLLVAGLNFIEYIGFKADVRLQRIAHFFKWSVMAVVFLFMLFLLVFG